MERGVFANSVRKSSGIVSFAKGDGSHLDTGGPTLSAVREELDLDLSQLDSELEHDGGDFGWCESEFGVAHLDQLTMRTESVQTRAGARFGCR